MSRTRLEKAEIMYKLFGICQGHICKDCCHMTGHQRDRSFNKCEVYGYSHSEATDFGVYQQACGLFNKETDQRDIYLRFINRKPKAELQPETLF